MQATVDTPRAYNKECNGCKNHEADIMITLSEKGSNFPAGVDFHDFFMTNEKAKALAEEILEKISQNSEIDYNKDMERVDILIKKGEGNLSDPELFELIALAKKCEKYENDKLFKID